MTLLDNYFPFDQGAGATATPARWRSMARYFYGSGVIASYLNALRPSQSGGIVTIQPGAAWIDGFYGENDAAKTLSVSGNGMVVARMDPNARSIAFVFVPNQTTPTQTPTGIYEIPLWNVTGATGTDIRQYSISPPPSPPTHSVVAQTTQRISLGTAWGGTTWAGWWAMTVTKVRPDTVFDFEYLGSAYGTNAVGWVEIGAQVTSPYASSVGTVAHFFFNTMSEHHSIVGALPGWGSELSAAGYTGNFNITVWVRCSAANSPIWRVDGNDYHAFKVTERIQ